MAHELTFGLGPDSVIAVFGPVVSLPKLAGTLGHSFGCRHILRMNLPLPTGANRFSDHGGLDCERPCGRVYLAAFSIPLPASLMSLPAPSIVWQPARARRPTSRASEAEALSKRETVGEEFMGEMQARPEWICCCSITDQWLRARFRALFVEAINRGFPDEGRRERDQFMRCRPLIGVKTGEGQITALRTYAKTLLVEGSRPREPRPARSDAGPSTSLVRSLG